MRKPGRLGKPSLAIFLARNAADIPHGALGRHCRKHSRPSSGTQASPRCRQRAGETPTSFLNALLNADSES